MSKPNPEWEKFKDDAVRDREADDAVSRLRGAAFVAVLGPGACAAAKALEFPLTKLMLLGVFATGPLAILLLLVYFFKLPDSVKGTKPVLSICLFTVAAVIATFVLAAKFDLIKALSQPLP